MITLDRLGLKNRQNFFLPAKNEKAHNTVNYLSSKLITFLATMVPKTVI